MIRERSILFTLLLLFGLAYVPGLVGQSTAAAPTQAGPELKLPLDSKSVRFAVIGDNGTGDQGQYDVAHQMEIYRKAVGYDFVIMLGDNIYGGHHPKDFEQKFEQPYKPLLDTGVKFYASLGNHDNSNEIQYKPFNMNGQRYYSFKKGDVQFFVLDSNYMDPAQLDWVQRQLRESGAKWKICYFHHPLYSDGKFHGADVDLRKQLEPLFSKYGVNVVMSGHDHVYERFKPEGGIYYFLLGSSGQLRYHNLRRSSEMVAGDDTHRTFMVVEVSGDKLYFQTIAGDGSTIDSGVLQHQPKPVNPPATQAQTVQ
jgi:predicted phosphodiesterase